MNILTKIISKVTRKIVECGTFPNHKELVSKQALQATQMLLAKQQYNRNADAEHFPKRPLFIDMGSNVGQGFQFFSEYYSPSIFDYVFIEPSPACVQALHTLIAAYLKNHPGLESLGLNKEVNFEIIEAAVSDQEGVDKLYGLVEDNRGQTSEGASIVVDHNSAAYVADEDQAIQVKTIDAKDLILNSAQSRPLVVVKMDIEGAEYRVLDHLISTNAIEWIDQIYIEWHTKFFDKSIRKRYSDWENSLRKSLGSKAHDWR